MTIFTKSSIVDVRLGSKYDFEFKHPYKITAWKASKYGVISGPYFPVFNPNIGKYGPEITSYSDNFHAVNFL